MNKKHIQIKTPGVIEHNDDGDMNENTDLTLSNSFAHLFQVNDGNNKMAQVLIFWTQEEYNGYESYMVRLYTLVCGNTKKMVWRFGSEGEAHDAIMKFDQEMVQMYYDGINTYSETIA